MTGRRASAAVIGAAVVVLLVVGLALATRRGAAIYMVSTPSMAPAVPAGAVVLVEPAPRLRVGEVVTFAIGDRTVTHRIDAVLPDGRLRTAGDGNADPDPTPIAPEQVLGRVRAAIPGLGVVVVFLQQPTTAAALLVAGVLLRRRAASTVHAHAPSAGEVPCTRAPV